MTELQKKLLDMMSAFHDLCIDEGLRYYVLGGTAIGAARHNGFIPWDDDVDVGMPRTDYEKLKKISKSLNIGKYVFEFPEEKNRDFVYLFGKMYDTTTTLIEHTRYNTKRGVYIDIFPLDGVGDTREESMKRYKAVEKKKNIILTQNCAWRKGRKLYKNLAIVFMRCIPEFLLSEEKTKADIKKIISEKNYDDCIFAVNYFGNWGEKEIFERKWFSEAEEYKFESIKVFGPKDIDSYLTRLYGDWRVPPPEEKQKSHHDYVYLNLTESYFE